MFFGHVSVTFTSEKSTTMDLNKLNLFGACTALYVLMVCILILIFRLLKKHSVEYGLGIAFMAALIPLVYLLFTASQMGRSPLYYIQLVIMIAFIIVELVLDYIFQATFRQTQAIVIPYVMFFFAGTGGMIGIAAQAGKPWAVISIILFFIMTFLAFYQRTKTGM